MLKRARMQKVNLVFDVRVWIGVHIYNKQNY